MSDDNDSNGPSVESPAAGSPKAEPSAPKTSPEAPAEKPSPEPRATAPAATPSEVEGAEANRRVRRTRQIQVEPAVAEGESAPASPRPGESSPRAERPRAESRPRPEGRPRGEGGRDGRPRRPRGPRPPRGREGARGRGDSPAVGQTEARRVFRQDVIAPVAAPPPPQPAPPKPHEKDKITLILHPAPKAAPERKKKKDRPKTAKEALREKTAKLAPKAEPKKAAPATLDPAWRAASEADAPGCLAQAGEAAEALAKAWIDDGNVGAIAAAARSEALSGKARKAARRALNVLKSRGVEIPEAAASEPVASAESVEAPVASFIPPDATGAMFVSISQRQPGGRYRVADAVIRQGIGVIQVSSGRIAGKQIRSWKNRVEDQFGAAPVQVPLDWARYLVAEARKQNDVSGQIVPLGFDNAQVLLGPAPATEPPHPLADLEEAAHESGAISKAVLGSDRLHNEPEFAAWMPDRPAIDELLRNVGEKVGAEGAQDAGAVDKALEEEIAAATDRFFTPELRKAIRLRMRDAAISIRARKGDDAAREVLSVAKGVEEAGLITAPPSEIPFLKSFFQKAIAVMLRQSRGQLRVPVRQTERGQGA